MGAAIVWEEVGPLDQHFREVVSKANTNLEMIEEEVQ